MKQIYLALLSCIFIYSAGAQVTDDFESYTAGSFLAQSSAAWTTWSNAPGGTEDVKVTDVDAFSGTKSVYFSSNQPNGGPTDVVLPFGTLLTTGQFEFEMMMKVENSKGAYFNFQGAQTIGQVWSLEVHLIQDGSLYMSSDGKLLFDGNYPNGSWFNLKMEVNLNTNQWDVYINGNLEGSFSNPINKVAALNVFPVNSGSAGGNGIAGFYIDDVSYTITPYTLPALNGAVVNINSNLKLVGQSAKPGVTVKNLGVQSISSFDISITYDGKQYDRSITGVNIPSLGTYTVQFDSSFVAKVGSNPMTATISNVNGQAADGDPADDVKVADIFPIFPMPGKIVIAEEATGPWCGWCPRGTVAMFEMAEKYPGYYKGIAVHNGNTNPMVVPKYDQGINTIINGYPSAVVDRGVDIDPSDIEREFLLQIQEAPAAILTNEAHYNGGTRELTVDVNYEFKMAATGNWKIAVVLTEDSVTGTSSAYAQVNYYSYQAANRPLVGAGFDWQQLPNPVPASVMFYDHVARAITPSFTGQEFSFPSNINATDTFHRSFSVTIDPTWNMNRMSIVSLLIRPDGKIDNAGVSKVMDATGVGIIEKDKSLEVNVHPNPTTDIMNIVVSLHEKRSVSVTITDITGKVITNIPAKDIHGKQFLPVDVKGYPAGLYFVQIKADDEVVVKKVMVQ